MSVTPLPSLQHVYDAIQAQLLVYVGASGAALPGFGIGQKDIFDNKKPPRISWMPMGGPVGPMKMAGGDGNRGNPRPLWTRYFSTAAFIKVAGLDIDAANTLAQHLVAAIDAVCHGGYKITKEEWTITGDLDAGFVVVIVFEIEIPFVDEKIATVIPTATTIVPVFTPQGP